MGKSESKAGEEIGKAYRFFDQAPVVIGFVRGEDYIIEFANQGLLKVWKVAADVQGKSLFAVFPELEKQGFRHLLDNVRLSGNPFTAYEFPIVFDRPEGPETTYFDFIYQPYYEGHEITGIISVGYDVTEKVLAKRFIERGEKKWKQLANSMPVMVWTADEKGSINFFNELWFQTTGLTLEESLGFGWTKALHPDDVDRCLDAWKNALTSQSFYELQLRYRKKEGDYQWVIARGVPVVENGELIGWYGTSTDITDQKKIEKQLEELVDGRTAEIQEKSTLLDNILKNSSNGITVSQVVRDDKGIVIDAQTILANDAAVKYSGLPKEDYLTKPASYFDPNLMSSPYGQACVKTLETGEPFIMRYFVDFSKRWLELTVSKMDNDRLIHHFTDVTSIKEAELRLEKTLEDLKFANTNLEEFAYAASHDLKEPIRKAQYFVNRLKEDLNPTLTAEQLKLFERLENSQRRMQKLIDDLLEYSQAAKGTAELEPINLNHVVSVTLEDLELEIQKTSANVKVNPLPTIVGNRRQLNQLFQNLVGNALKYRKPGVAPFIEISASEVFGSEYQDRFQGLNLTGVYHLITIADNGIGFDPAYAEKIFNVFTRLNTGDQYRGSGIGLSIVRKVVESHHGFVRAESEPGKGSFFFILFPK